MTSISDCIRLLLLEGETVVLPGFGSLKVGAGKSEGSPENGKIVPPGKTIKFSSDTPAGDEKLVECYARTAGIEADEAKQQVLELCDAIRFTFDKGESYILKGVGLFSRDEDNRISFEKDAMFVLEPDQFGLAALDLLELDQEEEVTAAASPVEPAHIQSQTYAQPQSQPQPQPQSSEPWKQPMKKKNPWKAIWIVTGSLIVILVVLLLIPVNQGNESEEMMPVKDSFFKRFMEKIKTEKVVENQENPVNDELAGENTADFQTDLNTGNNNQGQEGDNVSPEVAGDQQTEPEPSYFIIAGSFQNLQNATELMDAMTNRGFPAEIIYTENRMYRVAVRSFTDRDQAVEELPIVRKFKGLENAWLLSR